MTQRRHLLRVPHEVALTSANLDFDLDLHQVIPSDTAVRLQSGTGTTAIIAQQIANRSTKTDRLPIMQAKPQVNDKAPVQVPAQITPNPKFKTDCKPLIDILGRCFADARVNHKVT
jgi:hypothetical protein